MHRLGFTLVELIVTLIIVAFIGMMAVSFFQRSVTQQDVAVTQLKADASLQLVLENMIQAYGSTSRNSNDLINLSNAVGDVGESSNNFGKTGDANNVINYTVAAKDFVCPNSTTKTFDIDTNSHDQFLLLTIKDTKSPGVSLSYIFAVDTMNINSNNSNTNNSNFNACP